MAAFMRWPPLPATMRSRARPFAKPDARRTLMQGRVVKMSEAMMWEIPEPEPHHRFMGLMFERDITPTVNMAAGFVTLPPGQEQHKLSTHEGKEEIYLVFRGKGKFV